MSDSEEKKRPNANYKLSNENVDEENIVFYYNREHRLAKAPKAVQDLYKAGPPQRLNLFRPLVRTKPLAMMFGSIVVVCLIVLVISALGLASNSYDLEGNQLSIQAIKYGEAIIVALDKTTKKNGMARFFRLSPAYTGAVDIAVQPFIKAGGDMQMEDIFYHKIFFSYDEVEHFRFSVPFNTDNLALVLQTEKKTLSLTVKAE